MEMIPPIWYTPQLNVAGTGRRMAGGWRLLTIRRWGLSTKVNIRMQVHKHSQAPPSPFNFFQLLYEQEYIVSKNYYFSFWVKLPESLLWGFIPLQHKWKVRSEKAKHSKFPLSSQLNPVPLCRCNFSGISLGMLFISWVHELTSEWLRIGHRTGLLPLWTIRPCFQPPPRSSSGSVHPSTTSSTSILTFLPFNSTRTRTFYGFSWHRFMSSLIFSNQV